MDPKLSSGGENKATNQGLFGQRPQSCQLLGAKIMSQARQVAGAPVSTGNASGSAEPCASFPGQVLATAPRRQRTVGIRATFGRGGCRTRLSLIGKQLVRGGPEVRFHEGSTRVPPGFHEVLRGLRGGASTKRSSACCWRYYLSCFFLLGFGPSNGATAVLWCSLKTQNSGSPPKKMLPRLPYIIQVLSGLTNSGCFPNSCSKKGYPR